jgi:RNA polymerase sigma-70 factor (ECF subfamily)
MTSSVFGEAEPDEWAAVRSGDPAAFGALFELHRSRVLWQAMRSVQSFHDAEDIAALVFLEAWRKRDSVRVVNGSVLAWLLVTTNYVAKNVTRAHRRHRRAMESLPAARHQDDFAPAVNDRIDRAPRRAAVREAFARLSAKEQDVVSLCLIQEMTLADAASALGVPLGTVKSRLSRAKKKLAESTIDFADSTATAGGAR